jgi:hypothetical protein
VLGHGESQAVLPVDIGVEGHRADAEAVGHAADGDRLEPALLKEADGDVDDEAASLVVLGEPPLSAELGGGESGSGDGGIL